MNGTQQLTAAAGAGLLVLNFWTGPEHDAIAKGLFDKDASADATQNAHKSLVRMAAALLFVAVATLLSGVNGQLGSAMLAIIAALFVIWAINHFGKN